MCRLDTFGLNIILVVKTSDSRNYYDINPNGFENEFCLIVIL